jgi:hypothetical protein
MPAEDIVITWPQYIAGAAARNREMAVPQQRSYTVCGACTLRDFVPKYRQTCLKFAAAASLTVEAAGSVA